MNYGHKPIIHSQRHIHIPPLEVPFTQPKPQEIIQHRGSKHQGTKKGYGATEGLGKTGLTLVVVAALAFMVIDGARILTAR